MMVVSMRSPRSDQSRIDIQEAGPQKFALAVTFEGQRFECGTYISRAAAMQAGKLFAERKDGERVGQQKRPRKKR
jgi:hypothetical protein